ncbi:MAG TPA: metallophosphoesterase [Bryobacteraceae bacterium]|nr:metallophosphoesterase [Bryobacteraceae bacterium]
MNTRRTFLRAGATAAGAVWLRPLSSAAPDSSKFYFALIADTHIIDSFYKGPESNPEDTESMLHTTDRLESARTGINGLEPRIEQVFLIGDYFHDYPSRDIDFYFKNETRIDKAKALTDAFRMPVHVGFGNHDYSARGISRESSHELFRRGCGSHTGH